jgi:hypothetical protein
LFVLEISKKTALSGAPEGELCIGASNSVNAPVGFSCGSHCIASTKAAPSRAAQALDEETMKAISQHAAAFIAIIAVWSWSQPAAACKCMLLEPAAAAEQASAVFEGRVVEVNDVAGTPMPHRQVTLRVVRVWKGIDGERAVLTTAAESAACGIDFARDQNYLVYASKQDNALSANSCSRTRLIADAGEDIQALGMGWTPVDPKGPAADGKPAASSGKPDSAKPSEPPARGGCASCAVASKRSAPSALAMLLPAFWLIRRRLHGAR